MAVDVELFLQIDVKNRNVKRLLKINLEQF